MALQSTHLDCQPSTDWYGHRSAVECQSLCLSYGYAYAIVPPDLNCKCASASECTVVSDAWGWLIYKADAATAASAGCQEYEAAYAGGRRATLRVVSGMQYTELAADVTEPEVMLYHVTVRPQ